MHVVIAKIRAEFEAGADGKNRKGSQRFFKEEIVSYGVKTGAVHTIAERYWGEIKLFSKKKILALCEELLRSNYMEEAFVAAFWLPNLLEKLEPDDLALFKVWIKKYVNNWAKCDALCNHTVGGLIEKHPESLSEVKSWAKSSNRWLKRAAAVSLIIPAKKGKFLQEVFEISNMLLSEEGDAVQKGYGWLLKEASRKHQKKVFDYVIKNRKTMPRTALRYAIELMPKELKSAAMRKD
jgi:3-methyladenine DNA glycosylase AlkD